MHFHAKLETLTVQIKPAPAEPIPIPSTFKFRRSNSIVISKAVLERHRCFTTLQARRSKHMFFCNEALSMSLRDWVTHIGDHRAHVFPATKNEIVGNWAALVMPEAIPFRLGLMTYAAHLVFLHEDIEQASFTGEFDSKLDHKIVDGLEAALPTLRDAQSGSPSAGPCRKSHETNISPINRLLDPFIRGLMSTDHHTANEIATAWRKHYASPTPIADSITSLEAYIDSRVHTPATEAWLAMLRYALGLHLSQSSLEAIAPITVAAMRSVALTTDFWSWNKASRSPSNNIRAMNAVPFAMEELDMGETEAREKVKELAIEAEVEFSKLKTDFAGLPHGQENTEITTYLDAVEAFAAGHSLWCSTCPRYHGLL